MERLDAFHAIFLKVDGFGWWGMERIQTDARTHFNFKYFLEGLYVHRLQLSLASPYHK